MYCIGNQCFQKLVLAGSFGLLLSFVYIYSQGWSILNHKFLQHLPENLSKSTHVNPSLTLQWPSLSHTDLPHTYSHSALLLVAPESVSMRHVYITVRSVFLDTRLRNLGHKNASVFLIEARKDIHQNNLIIGCRVGKHVTADFKARQPRQIRGIHRTTHTLLLIDCFDLPGENGSKAFIIYKPSNDSVAVSTESERPLHIPAPHIPPRSGQNFTVVACLAVLYGPHPHFISEWLRYQRTIGIDHIHITAEDSFEKAGGFKNPYLKQGMDEGFVSVEVWTRWLNTHQLSYHSQLLAYEDCIYRLSGTYDYLIMVDTDDFFVPRVPGEPTIQYYVSGWCHNSGTCLLSWIRYYPDCGIGKADENGNVTAKLSSYVSFPNLSSDLGNERTKALHRPITVIDVGIHRAYQSLKGTKASRMPKTKAYIAHIRTDRLPHGSASHC